MIPDSAGDEYPDCKPIITHFVQTKFIDSMPHAASFMEHFFDLGCLNY
jgi:hypothetical protein